MEDVELICLYRRVMYAYWAMLRGVKRASAFREHELTEAEYTENFAKAKSSFYSNSHFYKESDGDVIFWVHNNQFMGEHLFSFDKEKIYNLFADYPHNLTTEERAIFDKETPYWKEFFKERGR